MLSLFCSPLATALEIQGAPIPRRVFTQPGPNLDINALGENVRRKLGGRYNLFLEGLQKKGSGRTSRQAMFRLATGAAWRRSSDYSLITILLSLTTLAQRLISFSIKLPKTSGEDNR
jgi:hypothetical protein